MILKILEKGSTKVYAPDDQVEDYLFLGFTDTGTTTEVVVTDPSKEIVEMKIEDDIITAFRYKGDTVWRTVAGGGGTDTYKVKVDGTDTADYLKNKLQQGTNVTITKSDGKLVISSTGGGLPTGGTTGQVLAKKSETDGDVEWKDETAGSGTGGGSEKYTDIATIKAVNTTAYTAENNGDKVQVYGAGEFVYDFSSTAIGDDLLVIKPNVGVGRWIKQSIDVVEIVSNPGNIWSNKIREPRIAEKKIKLLQADSINKKILSIGSSVMFGYCAATMLTVGKTYTIMQQGSTNFKLCGATDNYSGTTFTCTAVGTGTGVAKLNTAYPEQLLAKINANDSGWTLLNHSIVGNNSLTIYNRMWIDGFKENPGVVIIGACPNNDNLDSATTLTTIATALENFEKGMDKIVKACEENGVQWYIVGVYPKNTYTALPYASEKQLNIALQRKYGRRYINIYNILDNGSGGLKTIYDTGDGVHINEAAHKAIAEAFPSTLIERNRSFSDGINYNKGRGIILGADTTTAKPLEATTTIPNTEAHTFGFDFKPNAVQSACVLAYIGSTKEINVTVDNNGYIGLALGTTPIITTTAKPNSNWNRLRMTFTRDTNCYKLYLNKTLLGISTAQNQYFGMFSIGGGLTPANNAVGVEFRNVVHWTTALSAEEITEDFNNDILKSGLSFFNPLNSIPSSIFENYGITSQRRLLANSTLWTLGTSELDNEFTNSEKAKLANSITGTFTTVDGKTITVTGGMITSIV